MPTVEKGLLDSGGPALADAPPIERKKASA